jgi:hypothetical protein
VLERNIQDMRGWRKKESVEKKRVCVCVRKRMR